MGAIIPEMSHLVLGHSGRWFSPTENRFSWINLILIDLVDVLINQLLREHPKVKDPVL